MRKSALRIIAFIAILGLILVFCDRVFSFKYADGITQTTTFYEQPKDTVDVLFLGSSHAFVNFNNGTLWDEYGIASYNFGGSMQPMWNTYYYLKEALKTQSPELIVLDGYSLTMEDEYSDDSRIIKNTFGLKWSKDKVDAIKVSTPPGRFGEFLLSYGQYHNRYHDLNRGDFLWDDDIKIDTRGKSFHKDWKGQYLFYDVAPQTRPDVSGVDERAKILEKEEAYYRKILALAREKEIPIMVTIVPYVVTEDDQKKFNSAADIAIECGVEFLDCNQIIDEIGLDFEQDFRDVSHMNCEGSRKFSSYFGKYIKDRYAISDRRGDSRYNTWVKNAEFTSKYIKDEKLINTTEMAELGEALLDDEYEVFISVDGDCRTDDEELKGLFDTLGIEAGSDGMWHRSADGIKWSSGSEDAEISFSNELHNFCLKRSYDNSGNIGNKIIVDNADKKITEDGVNIVVYDNRLETVIDCIGISAEDYSITHKGEINSF